MNISQQLKVSFRFFSFGWQCWLALLLCSISVWSTAQNVQSKPAQVDGHSYDQNYLKWKAQQAAQEDAQGGLGQVHQVPVRPEVRRQPRKAPPVRDRHRRNQDRLQQDRGNTPHHRQPRAGFGQQRLQRGHPRRALCGIKPLPRCQTAQGKQAITLPDP